MALRDDLVNYIPKYLWEKLNHPTGYTMSAEEFNNLWNLIQAQGDHTAKTLGQTLTMLYETVLNAQDGSEHIKVGLPASFNATTLKQVLTLIDERLKANATGVSGATTTANAANVKAEQALGNSATAMSAANSANIKADGAVATSNAANAKADNAVSTANSANTKADGAVATANAVQVDYNSLRPDILKAIQDAGVAKTDAGIALTKANLATDEAAQAKSVANTAKGTADNAKITADTTAGVAEQANAKATAVELDYNTLKPILQNAVADAQAAVIAIGNKVDKAYVDEAIIGVQAGVVVPGSIGFKQLAPDLLDSMEKIYNVATSSRLVIPTTGTISALSLVEGYPFLILGNESVCILPHVSTAGAPLTLTVVSIMGETITLPMYKPKTTEAPILVMGYPVDVWFDENANCFYAMSSKLFAEDVGAVPATRTINNKPLTSNISITLNDIGALSSSNPVLNTRLKIDRGERFRVFKEVFHYATSLGTSNVIGILKIRLPVGFSNSMIRAEFKGFQYQTHRSWGLMFAGYNYNNAGQLAGSDWMQCTAKLDGDAPFSRVRVGYDGERCCILLGDVDTNWTYLAVSLAELMLAYGMIDELSDGWSAEILTSMSTISKVSDVPVQIPVPSYRTINGKALSSDISITKADVGLGNVPDVVPFHAGNYGNIRPLVYASRVLELADANAVIISAPTTAVNITVPNDSTINFPVGTAITCLRGNSGDMNFLPSSGVTLASKDLKRSIDGMYASATLIKTSANTWFLIGSLK